MEIFFSGLHKIQMKMIRCRACIFHPQENPIDTSQDDYQPPHSKAAPAPSDMTLLRVFHFASRLCLPASCMERQSDRREEERTNVKV
jgi:hypothetical protein